jgi:hypothetical protein
VDEMTVELVAVELVAVERRLWSGDATLVLAHHLALTGKPSRGRANRITG